MNIVNETKRKRNEMDTKKSKIEGKKNRRNGVMRNDRQDLPVLFDNLHSIGRNRFIKPSSLEIIMEI